jgi:hypothetical protein
MGYLDPEHGAIKPPLRQPDQKQFNIRPKLIYLIPIACLLLYFPATIIYQASSSPKTNTKPEPEYYPPVYLDQVITEEQLDQLFTIFGPYYYQGPYYQTFDLRANHPTELKYLINTDKGSFGRATLRIFQIIDSNSALVHFDGSTLHAIFPTHGKVDNETYTGIFARAGEYRYTTVLNAASTIPSLKEIHPVTKDEFSFYLKFFPLQEYLPIYIQDPAGDPCKACDGIGSLPITSENRTRQRPPCKACSGTGKILGRQMTTGAYTPRKIPSRGLDNWFSARPKP